MARSSPQLPPDDKIATLDRLLAVLLRVGFAVLGAWVIIKQQQSPPIERDYTLMLIGVACMGPFVVQGLATLLTAARGGGKT